MPNVIVTDCDYGRAHDVQLHKGKMTLHSAYPASAELWIIWYVIIVGVISEDLASNIIDSGSIKVLRTRFGFDEVI